MYKRIFWSVKPLCENVTSVKKIILTCILVGAKEIIGHISDSFL